MDTTDTARSTQEQKLKTGDEARNEKETNIEQESAFTISMARNVIPNQCQATNEIEL